MSWIRNWKGEAIGFYRYADDCNIYVKSKKAGNRVMDSVSQFIEK
jgi:retron-type reverse transcriptase